MGDRFVYVTYINTTAEKLWDALTKPEFTRQYWIGAVHESDWQVGSPWRILLADGTVTDSGEILEIDPPRRLVFAWRNEFVPEMHADGISRATYTIEPEHGHMKLTIVHESEKPDSVLVKGVSEGWPYILSSLKTLLETGHALAGSDRRPG